MYPRQNDDCRKFDTEYDFVIVFRNKRLRDSDPQTLLVAILTQYMLPPRSDITCNGVLIESKETVRET